MNNSNNIFSSSSPSLKSYNAIHVHIISPETSNIIHITIFCGFIWRHYIEKNSYALSLLLSLLFLSLLLLLFSLLRPLLLSLNHFPKGHRISQQFSFILFSFVLFYFTTSFHRSKLINCNKNIVFINRVLVWCIERVVMRVHPWFGLLDKRLLNG